jgi:hypothetical protein
VILGDEAPTWLGRHGFPARLVARDSRISYLGAWPADAA